MSLVKRVRGLCLAVLCLTSVLALGATGSASAAGTLLFKTENGKATYHLEGLSVGTSTLETVKKEKVTSTALHVLVLTLSPTLFHARILFLGVKAEGAAPCANDGNKPSTEDVLISLLGHLGLADPGDTPAVLLLIPSGFSFECEVPIIKTIEKIQVLGSVIGLITKPKILTASEELGIVFKQNEGKQEHIEFLLPGAELMPNQLLDSNKNGGAFVQAGEQTPEVVLKALSGEGQFLLIDE